VLITCYETKEIGTRIKEREVEKEKESEKG